MLHTAGKSHAAHDMHSNFDRLHQLQAEKLHAAKHDISSQSGTSLAE
jgi:hypothetical protein